MLKSDVLPQFGFPTSATLIVLRFPFASASISESVITISSSIEPWYGVFMLRASSSLTTSIISASLRLNDISYPSILYFIGSFSGALRTTSTVFPLMNPISTILLRNPPWPNTLTITPFSPVLNSDKRILLIFLQIYNIVYNKANYLECF